MFSGRRSARSGPGALDAVPASGATGDGLIGSAIAKTRCQFQAIFPFCQSKFRECMRRNMGESRIILASPGGAADPPCDTLGDRAVPCSMLNLVAAARSRSLSESLVAAPATVSPPRSLTWNHPRQASPPTRAASATVRCTDRGPQNS